MITSSKAGAGRLLCDVQVVGLDANTKDFASISNETATGGTNNKVQMTPNSVGNTRPGSSLKWHVLYVDIEPGVLNPGQTAPDLQMWLQLDDTSHGDLKSYMLLDLTQSRLMLPPRLATVGLQRIFLGRSMLKDAIKYNLLRRQGATAGQAMGRSFGGGNWPLKYTGPKIAELLNFHFSSTSGFTTSATDTSKTFASPPTIKLYGDVYDAPTWQIVQNAMSSWNGDISITSARRRLLGVQPNPYVATHNVAAGLNFDGDGFQQLPDGSKQGGGAVVHRFFRFTTPLNDVTGTGIYVLSNIVDSVNAVPGNVSTDGDFGFPFFSNHSALQITEFGHRPVSGSGYWGLTTGTQDRYPGETEYGHIDTKGAPTNWYGDAQPLRTATGLYFKLPSMYEFGGPYATEFEVLAGEDVAFFTSAQKGATITASSEYFALGGVMIEA